MRPEKQFDTLYRIAGQDVMVNVRVFVEPDDCSLDDVIGDAEDRETLARKIERGDLMIACIRVEATAHGCCGIDSLGAVYVEGPDDVNQTIADYSMVANACSDLERTILEQAQLLKPFVGGDQ